MDMETILGALAIVVAVGLLVTLILGSVFPRLGHRLFGWHVCDATGSDGCSLHGRCRICGKDCMMDSQGNWF